MKISILLVGLLGLVSGTVSADDYNVKICTVYGKIAYNVAQMRFVNNVTEQQALNAIGTALTRVDIKNVNEPTALNIATSVVGKVYTGKSIAPSVLARKVTLTCLNSITKA